MIDVEEITKARSEERMGHRVAAPEPYLVFKGNSRMGFSIEYVSRNLKRFLYFALVLIPW